MVGVGNGHRAPVVVNAAAGAAGSVARVAGNDGVSDGRRAAVVDAATLVATATGRIAGDGAVDDCQGPKVVNAAAKVVVKGIPINTCSGGNLGFS